MRGGVAVCAAVLVGCGGAGGAGDGPESGDPRAATPLDTTDAVAALTGFSGPEAVRHDPDQDVWFVANFGAGGDDPRDADGFISRVTAAGEAEPLRFMVGTATAPLHMPRGMFIEGDTLWVADVDGVHGFHRVNGRHLAFIDFRALEPGFLNDISAAPDGVLYVTDTGAGGRVYRVAGGGGRPEVVVDSLPAPPNGITWDGDRGAFLLAPWGDGDVIRALSPDGLMAPVIRVPAGRFDGIELVDGGMLLATQTDSSLWLVEGASARRIIRTRGRPADIGYDAGRRLVAVPYIALNRVDIWAVP
ncbi:MAG: hypothetical protein KY466_00260 [Gemmatimonadetes bacterium]|nr:hypothetical protein [Gemmatimonadota bacterium]